MDRHRKNPYAKVPVKENFTYVLRDEKGNVKKLWQANALGRAILRVLRRINPAPIAQVIGKGGEIVASHVKRGVLNHLAAYGVQLPGITGNFTNELKIANVVTNTGLAGIASRINGNGGEAAFTYIGIGTGTTAAAAADTALQTEITTGGGARAAATASRTTTTVTNDTATLVHTFTFTAGFAVTEAGALNAASSGILGNHQVFTAVNVVSSDTLQITVDLALADA